MKAELKGLARLSRRVSTAVIEFGKCDVLLAELPLMFEQVSVLEFEQPPVLVHAIFSSSSTPTEIFTSSFATPKSLTSRSRSGSQPSTRSAWSSRIGRRYSPVLCASAACSELLKAGTQRNRFGKPLIARAWMPRNHAQGQLGLPHASSGTSLRRWKGTWRW